MGFEVRAFGHADDFLHWHQIARADCLITDVRMPGSRALNAGAVCYISKPVHENELMDCINATFPSIGTTIGKLNLD